MTALAFTTNYLLSGEGSHVRIYNRKEVASGWLASRQVFVRQAIHGIAVSATENVLLIWGGSSIRAFALLEPSRDSDEPRISLSRTVHTSDWILDAVFRPDVEPRGGDGTYEVVLLTAHNALTSLSISRTSSVSPTVTDGQSQDPSGFVQITIEENLHELTSSSKCILYSAHLKWIEDHRILIASGTAFGEMILWSCTIRPGAPAVARLHQLLTGHEGSIFGVKISDPLPEPLPARLLASCSDDRTIRIWDIANLPESEIGPQMATDARETGFGNNLIGTIPGEARENTWAARAWGHLSRIWGVSFILSSELGPSLHLASFGEDATCQYWRLQAERSSNGGEDVKLRLQHLGFSSLHSGKNLWASAIALEAGEGVVIATGGADGSIALQTKSLPFVDAKATSQAWPIEQAVAAVPSGQRAKEKFRSYAYITKDELLLTMDTGDVMLLRTGRAGEEQTEQGSAWQWLGREEDIRGYSVVTSVPALSMAFFAGMKGTVFVYHPDTGIKEFGKCEGKVAALIASYQPESDNMPEHAALIATTVESKTASLYTLALHPEVIEQAKETVLQLPAGLVVTSLLVAVESKHEQAARQLPGVILGSRNGSLAVYQLGKADQGISLMPDYVLPRAHGQDAVTALAWIPNSSGAAVSGWVFSVGRDGTLSVHEAYLGASPVQMRLAHRTNLPVGPNLEGLRVDKQGRLLVWGFKSKHFVLYDVINEREIMSVECGGAHRNWSFNLLPTLDGGNLAWTKASGLYTQAHVKSSCQTTGAGGHGREIKALAVSPPMQGSRSVGDAKIQLVATGAEDTDIKIFRDDKDVRGRPNMQCLRTLRKHNTGIQQLQWSEDGSHLFSSGGFEEFFVWKINLVPVIGVAVFCESACPSKSELPDLRIMAFDVTTICGGDKTKESAMFNISMVYSDSTLKVGKEKVVVVHAKLIP